MNRMHSTADVREAGRSPTFESYSDVERHIARANSLRAEVTAQMLAAAFRSTAGALCIRAARWQRQRRTYGVLMRCSDRTLADIGIAREDIALVARGIEPGADQRSAGFVRRGWSATWACLRALPARLDGARRAQRDWRRAYGELMAYTDHELERSASGVLTSRRPSAAVGLRPGSPSRGAARRPPPRALLMACLIDNGRMVRQAPRFDGRLDVDRGEVEARVEPRWPTWWTVLEEISTRRARGAHHGPPIAHAPRPGAVQAR